MYYTDNRVKLKDTTKVFHNKQEAEAYAVENRSYAAHGYEVDKEENVSDIWYVPK